MNVPANEVFSAVWACDLSQSAIVRILFRLRGLPECEMTFEGLQKIGFSLLARREGREVVFGLIGQFWTLTTGILPFQPEEFVSFDGKGYAKVAGNLLAVPITAQRTSLITETRIYCTSSRSRALFTLYWLLIRPFSGLIRREWLRLIKQHAENRPS